MPVDKFPTLVHVAGALWALRAPLLTEVSVEAAPGGPARPLVQAQVPLADDVGRAAGLLQLLGQRDLVQGQAAGLLGVDDGVLQTGVDLPASGGRNVDLVRLIWTVSVLAVSIPGTDWLTIGTASTQMTNL